MKFEKILCLGNNSLTTDSQTTKLAQDNQSFNHGLIDDANFYPADPGYYHTSLYDIDFGDLLLLAEKFDRIVLLDLPSETWADNFSFQQTIKLANAIESKKKIKWVNKTLSNNPIKIFEKLLEKNKSFCISPFIELLAQNGSTTLCCHSQTPIKKINQIHDWSKDPDYNNIRNKMLAGELLEDHCSTCYDYEKIGIRSPRQHKTLEWVDRLNIHNVDELTKIENPLYYEVRASNVCNLQCRMCVPEFSNLIEIEYKKIGLYQSNSNIEYTNFNFIQLDNLKRLYVAGGEPSAQIEFYHFLEKCIEKNKTNFEFSINTNAVKYSDKLVGLLKHFTNLNINVSLEGYDEVNHYVRWPSDWAQITNNLERLSENEHYISFTTVISIYNITNLYRLFKFFDDYYPKSAVGASLVIYQGDILSPFIFPEADKVLTNLNKITKLKCYRNNEKISSIIDSLIKYYENNSIIESTKLKQFFDFNDRLDRSRNIRLKDYIPELEECRKYVL